MTNNPGKSPNEPTRPEAIAAGMPVGSADHTLRPDPSASADPIGVPEAAAGDFTLRPDPQGLHDPHAPATEAAAAVKQGAQAAGDRATELAGRVRDRASDLAGDIQNRLGGVADEARDRASSVYDDARTRVGTIHKQNMRKIDDLTVQGIDGLNRGKGAVERFVDENPLLVGVVGVAAGLLLGALLPRTRQEDKNLGPWADEVRDQGLRYAREVTSIGREFVQTALDPDNLNAAARKIADTETPPPPAGERAAHNL